MLHDNKVTFIIERNAEISQKRISRLAHDHGTEKLASEPSSTSRGDRSLNDSNLEIRASFSEHVGSAETTGASTDDDNVRLGVSVEVLKVASGHCTRDLGLANWSKTETLIPLVGHVFESLSLVVDREGFDVVAGLQWDAVEGSGRLCVKGRWWCHYD